MNPAANDSVASSARMLQRRARSDGERAEHVRRRGRDAVRQRRWRHAGCNANRSAAAVTAFTRSGAAGNCWRCVFQLFGCTLRLFLEALPLEQIQPPIGARVDEQLEIRIERELVVAREHGQLDAAVAREEILEPRDGLADVRQRHGVALPRPAAAQIVHHDVDGRRQLVGQVVKEIDDALGVRHDVRRVVVRLRARR